MSELFPHEVKVSFGDFITTEETCDILHYSRVIIWVNEALTTLP